MAKLDRTPEAWARRRARWDAWKATQQREGNPVAKSLRSPHVAAQIIPSGKVYKRRPRTQRGEA